MNAKVRNKQNVEVYVGERWHVAFDDGAQEHVKGHQLRVLLKAVPLTAPYTRYTNRLSPEKRGTSVCSENKSHS